MADNPASNPPGRALHRPGFSWAPPLAIVLLAGLAYIPAYQAGWVFDDDVYVTDNPKLRDLQGLRQIWSGPTDDYRHQWYPVTSTVFWLQYQLWGVNPAGYHAVNVALHLGAALLLGAVLLRLGLPPGAAWLAAAVFAVHPVNVMSVAWVTELKNTLSGLLFLITGWLFLRTVGVAPPPASNAALEHQTLASHQRVLMTAAFIGCLGLFLLTLLSKTATASLPAMLLLIMLWRRPARPRLAAALLAGMATLAVALGALTLWLEHEHGSAGQAAWTLPRLERVVLLGQMLVFYAGKLLWPAELIFIYPRWAIDAGQWTQWAPLLAVGVVLAVMIAMRRVWGAGPLVAAFAFALAVGPMAFMNTFMMRYTWVADHWQYWASMAMIPLVIVGLMRGLHPLAGRGTAALLAVILLPVLAGLTWRQAGFYADNETLLRATLARNDASWKSHTNLGELLLERGELEAAMPHLIAARMYAPTFETAALNLGKACYLRGEIDAALWLFREAERLRPGYLHAQLNQAALLTETGRLEQAGVALKRARSDHPDAAAIDVYEARLRNRIGVGAAREGDLSAARVAFEQAVKADPEHLEARLNLAAVHARLGRHAVAAAAYEQALALIPPDRHAVRDGVLDGLAEQFLRAGDHGRALEALRRRSSGAVSRRAALLFIWLAALSPDATGEPAHAVATSGRQREAALRLADQLAASGPDPAALDARAALLARLGRFDQAAVAADRAAEQAEAQALGGAPSPDLVAALRARADAYRARQTVDGPLPADARIE